MIGDRWEHGSELHWPADGAAGWPPRSAADVYPWGNEAVLTGSGRDALRLVLEHGRRFVGWRRLYVPSFLCQEVVQAAVGTGLPTRLYPDRPTEPFDPDAVDAREGDVVLVVNHFGLRDAAPLDGLRAGGAAILEDHTHDPWSPWAQGSDADFAIASLRKTLPVPEGGVAWSPSARALPDAPPVTPERERAAGRKLAAMVLKGLYLDGHPVEKDAFRRLAMAGEDDIARGEISAVTEATRALLRTFPVNAWREVRRANHALLAARLGDARGVTVLRGDGRSCPFSAILVFDSGRARDAVKRHLIDRSIYPAVLWPLDEPVLEGLERADLSLSRRVLSLHCDMRYGASDLDRVADAVIAACREGRG
ncbi:MAG: hypothetical protein ACQEXJ_16670 [Myxococcota bacterium]